FGPETTHNSEPSEGGKGRSYLIANVEPGKYRVQVNPRKGYAASVRRNGVDLLQQPLIVAEGESGSPIEVTLRDDGGEVSGLVAGSPRRTLSRDDDEDDQPFAFVYFVPQGDGLGQFREAAVEPDGSFREEQLPPGTYRVMAFDRPRGEWESAEPSI